MSCAQEEMLSENVILSRKEYELMLEKIGEARFAVNYFLNHYKPNDHDDLLGGTYHFIDDADRKVFEQTKNKLEERT